MKSFNLVAAAIAALNVEVASAHCYIWVCNEELL
jgi:hypothetical protein